MWSSVSRASSSGRSGRAGARHELATIDLAGGGRDHAPGGHVDRNTEPPGLHLRRRPPTKARRRGSWWPIWGCCGGRPWPVPAASKPAPPTPAADPLGGLPRGAPSASRPRAHRTRPRRTARHRGGAGRAPACRWGGRRSCRREAETAGLPYTLEMIVSPPIVTRSGIRCTTASISVLDMRGKAPLATGPPPSRHGTPCGRRHCPRRDPGSSHSGSRSSPRRRTPARGSWPR